MTKMTLKTFNARFPDDDAVWTISWRSATATSSIAAPVARTPSIHRAAAAECAAIGHPPPGRLSTHPHKPRDWFFVMYLFTTTRNRVSAKKSSARSEPPQDGMAWA